MTNRPQKNSLSATSSAAGTTGLIEVVTDYDTHTSAWVEFDAQMSAQMDALEHQFQQYWTPQAIVKSLRS